MKKSSWITIIIITLIIVFAVYIKTKSSPQTPDEIAKCIGKNSVLYVQLGCHACKAQEDLFGESYKNLNTIDCFYTREKCTEIAVTPTWIIKNEKY